MARAPRPKSPLRTGRVAALAIPLLAGALYWNSLDAPFVFDDKPNIVANPAIQVSALDARWLRAAWNGPTRGRPVAYLSFALNHGSSGFEVRAYHLTNVAIHALCGLTLYGLALVTLELRARTRNAPPADRSRDQLTALFAALLFVAHPVQTQAVTYVVQRMTSLAALFYLLALLLYLRGRLAAPGAARAWRFGGAAVAWLLALGTKQTAVTLPFAILLYEILFFADLQRSWWRRHGWTLVLAGLAVLGLGALYLRGDPTRFLDTYATRDFTLAERLLTQPRVVVFYLSLVFLPLPARLNLLHEFVTSRSLVDPPTTLLCIALLLGLAALAFRIAPRERLAAFCVLWFFLQLALESSFIALEMVYEHRLYLPMVGVCLLAADVIFRALSPRRAVALASVLVAVLGAGSVLRNETWRHRVTFWSDVAAKSPGSARAHNSLASALIEAGRFSEAAPELEQALRLAPDQAQTHYNMGLVAFQQGRYAAAVTHYRRALELQPRLVAAHNNLAAALARQGRLPEAIRQLEETLQLEPQHVAARANLILLLQQSGRSDEAQRQRAIRLEMLPEAEARRLR